MQITTGIRSILSNSTIYVLVQKIMGSEKARLNLYNNIVSAQKDDNVLDIGCGPATSFQYMPQVKYWGFDISEDYITSAKKRFGDRGTFSCKYFDSADLEYLPKMEIALMTGVLHHMDDNEAIRCVKLAREALTDNGRLITIDPVFVNGQNPIARFLISKDRGQNVRDEEGYRSILETAFPSVETSIKHKKFIPYTHCISISKAA